MSRLYITLFNRTQFLMIEDLTDIDKNAVWAALQDKEPLYPQGIKKIFEYACRADPEQGLEVWTCQSDLKRKELWEVAKEQPSKFIDLVRQEGTRMFSKKQL